MRKLTNMGIIGWLVSLVVHMHRRHAPKVHLLDPQFHRSHKNYLIQVALATGAMFVILSLVDSLSDAALAAGLGSSVLIVFLNPSNRSASPRSLIGGHFLGALIGLGFSLLLFSTPLEDSLTSSTLLRGGILAASVGILMLVMSTTDTEHPPAAGTVLGIATKAWDPFIMSIIIGAVLLLAFIKFLLNRYLHDLI